MKSSLSLESPDWKKMVSNNWIFDVNKCVIALLLQLQHISRDFRLGNSLHYLYAMWKCSCLYSAWEMTFTQYFMEFGHSKVISDSWKRGGLITNWKKRKCHFPFWDAAYFFLSFPIVQSSFVACPPNLSWSLPDSIFSQIGLQKIPLVAATLCNQKRVVLYAMNSISSLVCPDTIMNGLEVWMHPSCSRCANKL